MLPRLRSPQFGLLDDGQTLIMASALTDDWRQAFYVGESGRFVPFYWLFYWGVHLFSGDHPLAFFLVNGALLVGITAGLMRLVRMLGGGRLEACVAGLAFALSAPIIEGFYTLSKAEPPQLGWIVLSLFLVAAAGRVQSTWAQALLVAATAGALLAATLTKETGIIMIPISCGWLGVAWWFRRAPDSRRQLRTRAHYVVAALLAGAMWIMLRHVVGAPAIDQGGYTRQYRLGLERILTSTTDWLALFARDATWMFPLVLVVVPLAIRQGWIQQRALLDVAVWMIGWTVVFLPWASVLEYYMLPFTFGSAAAGGLALGQVVRAARTHKQRTLCLLARAALGMAALLLPLNLANSATAASIQLAVDAANERVVRFLGTLPAQALVTVSAPSSEYLYEIVIHLERLARRPDIFVEVLDPSIWEEDLLDGPVYATVPFIQNHPIPSVRIGVSEADTRHGRAVLTEAPGPIYRTRRRVSMLIFNLQRPLCTLIGGGAKRAMYCRTGRLWDRRMFSYGWDVYRLDRGGAITSRDTRSR